MSESFAAMGSPALAAGERLSPRSGRETGVGGSPRRANRLVHVLRALYLVLASIFAAGVLVQAYLAGLGIFAAGPWLEVHSGLGWTLALVAIGLLVLVFASRQPRQIVLLNLVLFVLLFVQVGLVSFFRGFGNEVAALHPLNALLLFGTATLLAYRASRRPLWA